jgi:[protein-PII] uridylyltransferase
MPAPDAPSGRTSAEILKSARSALLARLDQPQAGPALLEAFDRDLARLMDQYFRHRLEEMRESRKEALPPLAVVAQGGYGRGELCPGSDIDILLLFPKKVPAQAADLARDLFFPLWDLGLDLGHGVRSVSECLDVAKGDFQVLASLLDARFLCGERAVLTALTDSFGPFVRKRALDFERWLATRNAEREASYGDATGLLEPDLKNGIGGLRDVHQVLWVCKAVGRTRPEDPPPPFTALDMAGLAADSRNLLRARTALHAEARRKQDRLYLDLQPGVARRLGYTDLDQIPAVELFLAHLHRAMRRVREMRTALFREMEAARIPERIRRAFPHSLSAHVKQWPSGLGYAPDTAQAMEAQLRRKPGPVPLDLLLAALDLFLVQAREGEPVGWSAWRLAQAFFKRLRGRVDPAPELFAALTRVFTAPHVGLAASGLLGAEALAALVPEFGRVQNLVQFDAYHLHPLGVHTVDTLAGVMGMGREENGFREIFNRVQAPSHLALAAFFHDIGKGGEDHAKKGAALARDILARFGLDGEDIEEVAFLVAQHLLLPVAAARVDLADETQVGRLAVTVGSAQRLDMLYLLSVADSRATGPKAWNEWTASLMAELHTKLHHLLSEGPLARPHTAQRVVAARDKVRLLAEKTAPDLAPDGVEEALSHMPQRYLLVRKPEEIVEHLRLIREMREELAAEQTRRPGGKAGLGLTVVRDRPLAALGCHELTFSAKDQTGLFAAIAGAFALHDMNVLAADIFTFSDGTVLDIFTVSPPPDTLFAEEAFARVRRSVHYALSGKLSLEERLAEKRGSLLARKTKATGRPPRVVVDNESSDFFTLLEARADDRPGLLYDVLSALCRLGLDIHAAKVGTKVDRVADVFHVRDALGGKIADPDRIAEIKKALTRALKGS